YSQAHGLDDLAGRVQVVADPHRPQLGELERHHGKRRRRPGEAVDDELGRRRHDGLAVPAAGDGQVGRVLGHAAAHRPARMPDAARDARAEPPPACPAHTARSVRMTGASAALRGSDLLRSTAETRVISSPSTSNTITLPINIANYQSTSNAPATRSTASRSMTP